MANGKYTFEDMAAEKSNAQDFLDIYLRNKKSVPAGEQKPMFDPFAHQNELADYTNKIDQYFNPTPAPTPSQLIEQRIPKQYWEEMGAQTLGQRKAAEAAVAAAAQQAAIRDQIRSGTGITSGIGTDPQSRGGTQPTPTSTTPTGPTRVPPAVAARQTPSSMDIYSRRGTAPTTTETTATTDPDLTAIQDTATGDVDPVNTFLKMLEKMESDDARAQWGFDQGIINADVLGELRAQEAAGQPMNINLGVNDVKVDGVSAGQKAIFKWTEPDETGKRTIEMIPEPPDGEEEIVEGSELVEEEEVTTEEELGEVVLEEEDQYLNDQLEILTETYNDRVDAIQTAVTDGNTDINNAQIAFNEAKDILFDQMAELNKATYGTVEDEFQARTTQRGTDVADMLALLAGQGVEQNLIQDVIGGDIGMNLAGYGEETDAMRDFMGALELIGQQGSSEAEMLGNYMFDSYRQDLDTTGRNMELQSAMQMLAEQQSAAEQNLQSSMLGPYFGLDPEMMMAGMGAGVDMAGYAEGRTARDDAADMAYQDNVWDYMMSQTMTPYQTGMLDVAQQGQQMDTMSTLWDLMNPQPTAADAAQAQMGALDSALAKMRAGGTPAQAPSPANNWMGSPAMPAEDIYTGEEIMAMQDAGMDVGQMMLDQQTAQVGMQNMGSFAEAMNIPLENLMGAQSLGVLKELVDDFQFYRMGEGLGAVSADALIPFVYPPSSENPEGTMGMVPQSDWLNKFEIFYPDANNRDFQLGEGGPWLSGEMTPQEYFEVATMASVDAESLQDLLRYFYFPNLAGE
jgi:hypothetical protein